MSLIQDKNIVEPTTKFHGNANIKSSIHCCEMEKLVSENPKIAVVEETPNSQLHQRCFFSPSTITHLLVMIFGTSAWIGVNGIFIQLPLLVNSSPESWRLAAYLVIIIQAANIAPIIYSLLRKFSFRINEIHCILGMLGLGSFVMGLLGFLYDKTSKIAREEYSTALFILTFFTAVVSCTSSVLFMPYLRNFKEVYLVSYFIGEGLSGVLPSIVALIQGIDESPTCSNDINVNDNQIARFSSQHYFLFIFTCLVLSAIAFYLLENLSFIKSEKNSQKSDINSSNNDSESCQCQREISVLSEDSISVNHVTEKHINIDNFKKTDVGEVFNTCYTQNKNNLTLKDLYLYILLSVICLLANGFLPSLQPYSCLSYGNMTYHLSATFSQIANPTACFLALWYLPLSKKIINWLSVVIFVASGYIIYLALVSPNPPFKNSRVGDFLVVLSWILLVALISYVKLIITSVFRKKSEKTLFYVGVTMQTGSAIGAVLSFILINYTNLLQEYKSCNVLKN